MFVNLPLHFAFSCAKHRSAHVCELAPALCSLLQNTGALYVCELASALCFFFCKTQERSVFVNLPLHFALFCKT